MQISSISAKLFNKIPQNINKQEKKSNPLSFNATYRDFISNSPSIYIKVNQQRINLGSDDVVHLTDVGEHLRTTDDRLIRERFAQQDSVFGGISQRKTDRAYSKIMPYVAGARRRYGEIVLQINSLKKNARTTSDYARIAELERMKLRMELKADDAMKYTDRLYVTLPVDEQAQKNAELAEYLDRMIK